MRLIVNGATYDVAAPPHETLLTTLRDRLELTGAKLVCGRGECGACTVLLDGDSVYSCLTLTAACGERSVTTIEGLAGDGELHPVQAAFVEHDALQCGFCTPGQILAAVALLSRNPRPTEDDVRRGLSGNLCRCGAYPKIVRAVLAASGNGSNA
ncbi:MAG TPA: (2Fe-2S)-binding protein [Gemmatimonadaceae bacterium]|jgi:aerobic-type carbon monoxide dehydrogenase small subunit (CoxS/CutS family)|nr:(2Fe-2S)-binding protein [Gemmatimonadaceae bacterium]